jgi:hypothetical protein
MYDIFSLCFILRQLEAVRNVDAALLDEREFYDASRST